MIREDLIEDFIIYVNKNCISPNATINPSIYETNSFILQSKKDITLFEYAAFFGSIQIFTYLKNVEAKLSFPILFCTVHSKNAELIHFFEEYFDKGEIKEFKELYGEFFLASIICHHNEITNYLINKCLQNKVENSYDTFLLSLEYYNFSFLQKKHMNESSFGPLCLFDYCSPVKTILEEKGVDVNEKIVQNHIF